MINSEALVESYLKEYNIMQWNKRNLHQNLLPDASRDKQSKVGVWLLVTPEEEVKTTRR